MVFKVFLLVVIFASFSTAANILAILPTPSYSHQIAYTYIWKELSLRGHKVTLITADPVKDPLLTNLTEVDMKWTYSLLQNISQMTSEFTMWNMHERSNSVSTLVSNAMLSSSEVQNLIHNKSHFDVVLVEFLFPEFLAFAEVYNCPKIIFSSLDASAIIHQAMGNPLHPVLNPEIGVTFSAPLSFKDRVVSTLYTWYTLYFYSYKAFADRTELVRKHFNVKKTVNELVSDVDLLFINVNPILQPIRALGPAVITIGDNRPDVSPKPLPNDVADFLDSAKSGFVYFSLGSNMLSKDLDKDSLNGIMEALRQIPYKVLWKFEADELPDKPVNIKLIKWAPQQTILSHPNIKVFVTQGGLQSFEEALYREVPFVVIPFFADQDYNAKLMVSKGLAIAVDRQPFIKKTDLKDAILEVASNPKYKNAVKQLKHLALDSPMTGLEKAVWWTEYVIRNKGAKHLRNPAADIPSYQYYLIDVISFLISIVLITLILIYLVIRVVYKYSKLFIYRIVGVPSLKDKKVK